MKSHDYTFKRRMAVSAVDANTGSYNVYTETVSDPVKAVMSSSAIPFVFPSQEWTTPNKYFAIDGGSVWNLNLVSAVQRCREIVDDDSKITIDIITVHGGKHLGEWKNKNKAINNYLRFTDIKDYYDSKADIWRFMQAFPNVNFRYLVEPSGKLPGGLDIIKVDNKTVTWPCQVMGRKDGADAVNKGEGKAFEEFSAWMLENEQELKGPSKTLDLEFLQE